DCSDSTRDTYRIALQQLASPIIDRDTLRQAGAQRPRGSKTPLLDKWLDEQDLSIPNKALFWQVLPTDNFEGAYRDGNKVCESNHEMRIEGFNKRVTEARKRKKRR